MFNELDVVRLKDAVPSVNLAAGSIGTVVYVYDADPGLYEVEFLDSEGMTIALITLAENVLVLEQKVEQPDS